MDCFMCPLTYSCFQATDSRQDCLQQAPEGHIADSVCPPPFCRRNLLTVAWNTADAPDRLTHPTGAVLGVFCLDALLLTFAKSFDYFFSLSMVKVTHLLEPVKTQEVSTRTLADVTPQTPVSLCSVVHSLSPFFFTHTLVFLNKQGPFSHMDHSYHFFH